MRRLAGLFAILLLPVPAAAQDEASDLAVEVATLRSEWRIEEANAKLAELTRLAPTASTTIYLTAELAFLNGDYAHAAELLDSLTDEQGPRVQEMRKLVTGTYAATRDFATYKSAEGHFIIGYAPGKDELIAPLAADVLEAAYKTIGEDLGYFPPSPVRVEILGEPSDLARVSSLTTGEIETTGTIALCKYNKLMAVTPRATVLGYPWMDTLAHEYTHFVVSRVSQDQTPVWLHEGLARFEQVRWRKQIDLLSASESRMLARALKKNSLITFDAMHPSMAKLPSQEAAALAFAEVFSMIGFVHGQVGYAGLRQVLELEKTGTDPRQAVAQVMTKPFADVEAAWKKYLATVTARPQPAGDKPADRIRFRKGKSDDENVGIEEVASAEAKKFTRLGGLLRARGMTAAAAVEYEKALAAAGKNEHFIVGKLARTYLELGQADKAAKLIRPLVATDERDAGAATTLGRALLTLEDHAGARDALEQALRISPFDPMVRCGLAESYAKLADSRAGRERAACDALKQ